MKKAILSVSLFFCVAAIANAQETVTPNPVNPNAPKFKFETEVIDYGTIEHNANGDRVFKFTNVGKEPLIITNAVGSCGCTTPSWPKEPIMPGKSGEIKVHYATDRVGVIDKTVTITSNADVSSKVLRIKGVVKPDPTPAVAPPATTPPAEPVAPVEQKK